MTSITAGEPMTDLYQEPALYGINDVTVAAEAGDFRIRIYYPSEGGMVFGVRVRPGTYPLVAFAHGQRLGGGVDSESILSGPGAGCPDDVTLDHQRWNAVLHLLARCGFVVVAPAMHDVVASSEAVAARLEAAIGWIRWEWEHRVVLWGRELFLDPDSEAVREAASADPADASGLAQFGMKHLGEGIGVHRVRPGTRIPGSPTNLGLGWPFLGSTRLCSSCHPWANCGGCARVDRGIVG